MTLAVLMVSLALATLVSEDLTCIATGLLVAQGRIGFLPGVLACFIGILAGDVLLFLAGRWLGRPWLRRAPLRLLLSEERVERSSRWFRERGPMVILISRFLPGARLPTYFAAGALQTSLARFTLYFSIAVGIWTPILVAASWLAGERAVTVVERAPAWILLALGLWVLARVCLGLLTWRGRRLLLGRWRRWTRWEFWPLWLFYPPVVAKILWLGIRYRSPTLFTAANPGIPAAGFIGESKSEILDCLDPAAVAPYRRVSADMTYEERISAVEEFRQARDLDLPLVLKPDAGQRGEGVVIARDEPTVTSYIAQARRDFIVQELVSGVEYGVFWVHLPGEEGGRIFSVTQKVLPFVLGDGETALEKLILADPRAVAMARFYLESLAHRLDDVPEGGEQVALAELGTHCRGAVFLDGSRLITPRLEEAIAKIAASFGGFSFGRFDLLAPTEKDFCEGRDLRVVELNGVTSEATHIYDPSYGLIAAYRVLFRQWELAFEVGRLHRAQGVEPVSMRRLLGHWMDFHREAGSPADALGQATTGKTSRIGSTSW